MNDDRDLPYQAQVRARRQAQIGLVVLLPGGCTAAMVFITGEWQAAVLTLALIAHGYAPVALAYDRIGWLPVGLQSRERLILATSWIGISLFAVLAFVVSVFVAPYPALLLSAAGLAMAMGAYSFVLLITR